VRGRHRDWVRRNDKQHRPTIRPASCRTTENKDTTSSSTLSRRSLSDYGAPVRGPWDDPARRSIRSYFQAPGARIAWRQIRICPEDH